MMVSFPMTIMMRIPPRRFLFTEIRLSPPAGTVPNMPGFVRKHDMFELPIFRHFFMRLKGFKVNKGVSEYTESGLFLKYWLL